MHKFKLSNFKFRGLLKENVGKLPKILSFRTKREMTNEQVFEEAASYMKKKHNVQLVEAEINENKMEADSSNLLLLVISGTADVKGMIPVQNTEEARAMVARAKKRANGKVSAVLKKFTFDGTGWSVTDAQDIVV